MSSIFLTVAFAWASSQLILKPIIASLKARRFVSESFWWQGGMPSSHAAFVSSLCASVGIVSGFTSTVFDVALAFSILVIYEALFTRNILNRQGKTLQSLSKKKIDLVQGHRLGEVVAGIIYGILIAYLMC